MRRLIKYFYSGCLSYTAVSVISIILHIITHRKTIEVNSYIGLIILILLIQTVLYFMENLEIKSQTIHISLELIIIITITFAVGIPIKLFIISSLYRIIEVILITAAVYAITMLILYLNAKSDAEYINNMLRAHH